MWYAVYPIVFVCSFIFGYRHSKFVFDVWRKSCSAVRMSPHQSIIVGIFNYNDGPIITANKHRGFDFPEQSCPLHSAFTLHVAVRATHPIQPRRTAQLCTSWWVPMFNLFLPLHHCSWEQIWSPSTILRKLIGAEINIYLTSASCCLQETRIRLKGF